MIDAHSRRVIGWAIDEHMRTDLVEDALRMAITLHGELPAKVVFHTDRGTQGEFQRSSQHLEFEGVADYEAEGASTDSGWEGADAVSGAAHGQRP